MRKPIKNIYTKFLGSLIKKGNKIAAKRILDTSFIKVSTKHKIPVHLILNKIFSKLDCFLEIKKIRIRKNVHIVPFPLNSKRQNFLKIKWILESAKEDLRKVDFSEKISSEVSNILLNKKSKILSKKDYIRKQALMNRSNLHYR
jgi:ribosomal protein S7